MLRQRNITIRSTLSYYGLTRDEIAKIIGVLTNENFEEFCEIHEIGGSEIGVFSIKPEDSGRYEEYGFEFAGTYELTFDGLSYMMSESAFKKCGYKLSPYENDYFAALEQFIFEKTGIKPEES